jgi:hypothetical protein
MDNNSCIFKENKKKKTHGVQREPEKPSNGFSFAGNRETGTSFLVNSKSCLSISF